MKLTRRDKPEAAATEVEEPVEPEKNATASKGRPTPKRRDSAGRRGPVTAPRTRKEAYARQKQQAREQRASASPAKAAKPRSVAEQRAALKRGDPSALPRRDQGPTRKLARDFVDSRRMLSNYLLWLFPIFIAISFVRVPGLQLIVLVLLVVFVIEWYLTGKKIRALARERHGSADGSNMGIGFYAGSRAYLPRKWRMPGAQVQRGDDI